MRKLEQQGLQPDQSDYSKAIAEIEQIALSNGRSLNRRSCQEDLVEIVEGYLFRRSSAATEGGLGVVKGEPRAKRLRQISNALDFLISEYTALLSKPRYIAPLVWALASDSDAENYDWEEAEAHVHKLLNDLAPHAKWLAKATSIADAGVKKRGNSGSLDRGFVSALADFFEDYTGEMPKLSTSSDPNITGDERNTGPFVRFVKRVVSANSALGKVTVKWGAMVKEALDARRKNPDTEEDKASRESRRQRLMLRFGISDMGK